MSESRVKQVQKPSAAVIGGGISGMAAAARLSKAGYAVTLFEAGGELGGKLTDYRWEGFRFDKGPSLFTMPELLEGLFKDCGRNIHDYINYHQLKLVTRYFYPDGTQVNAWRDIQAFADELESKLGEPKHGVLAYFKRAKLMYDTTAPVFLHRSLQDLGNLLRFSTFLRVLKLPWLGVFKTMHQFNRSWFQNAKVIQLFDRFATYNGSDPYRAPGTLSLISYIEHGIGAFYPVGGMIAIRNALAQLLQDVGVDVKLHTKIEGFFIHQDEVKGVKIGGFQQPYDLVVSAIDIMQVNRALYPAQYKPKATKNPELSSSAIIFHWAIKGNYPALDLHNIFFNDNYKSEFEHIAKGELVADPTIYVYVSVKENPSDAPAGHENWFVMVNTPPNAGQDWDTSIAKVRDYAQKRLNAALGIDLKGLILSEHVMDPRYLERNTFSVGGAIYGPASNSKWSAFLRQSNKHQQIKHLYFCGGSVHPGGGIPLCLLSAKITVDLIAKAEN